MWEVLIIPSTQRSCGGVYWFHSVRPSVRLSHMPCPLCNVHSSGWILSILGKMITAIRGCVVHNDLWPWPISSRSLGLDLENRVRSVASTVTDGFFLYLAQIITIIRGCVACYDFFRVWRFEFLAFFKKFSALTLKKNLEFLMDSFDI